MPKKDSSELLESAVMATDKQKKVLLSFGLPKEQVDILPKGLASIIIANLMLLKGDPVRTEHLWCPCCGRIHYLSHDKTARQVRDYRLNAGYGARL